MLGICFVDKNNLIKMEICIILKTFNKKIQI